MRASLLWRRFRMSLVHWMPIFEWLPAYTWQSHILHDLVASLLVAGVTLPQELAFGAAMHYPVAYTLRTAVVAPLVYCICGTSSTVSFANAAELSWSVGGILQTISTEQDFDRLLRGFLLTCLSGLILLVFGLFGLGNIVPLSRSSSGGFLFGSSLLVIFEHLPHVFGFRSDFFSSSTHLPYFQRESCLLGLFSLLILIVSQCKYDRKTIRIRPSTHQSQSMQPKMYSTRNKLGIPDIAPLFVCFIGLYFHEPTHGPNTLEENHQKHQHNLDLSAALHHIVTKEVADLLLLMWDACVIALTTYVSTLALAHHGARRRVLADFQRGCDTACIDVDSNKELVAYGLATIASGTFHALPPTGGLSRTAINSLYGRTPVTTLCTTLILLSCMTFDAYFYVAMPCLAAIVVFSIGSFIDTDEPLTLYRCRLHHDMIVWLFVLGSTFSGGIMLGAFTTLMTSIYLNQSSYLLENGNEKGELHEILNVGTHSLCFATWEGIERQLDLKLGDAPDSRYLVLNLSQVREGHYDLETLTRIASYHQRLKRQDIDLYFMHVTPNLQTAMESRGISLCSSTDTITNLTQEATIAAIESGIVCL